MVHKVSLRLHKVSWVDIFYGQRVFLTKRGYFGVGAPGLLKGDTVSVRFSSSQADSDKAMS
jgi:hypothetical protein